LPTFYAGMIAHIAQGRLPLRDNRINPRVIKKKMSNFPKNAPNTTTSNIHKPRSSRRLEFLSEPY
jgi:hypothetical protein